jgi:hypothetical protein
VRTNAQTIDVSTEIIRIQVRTVFKIEGQQCEVTVYLVHRLYVEAERMVIVTSAVVEPVEVLGVKVDGIRIRHRGWTFLEPTASNDGTIFKMHHVTAPQVMDPSLDRSQDIHILMNMLIKNIPLQLERQHELLESRLLTEGVRG